MNWYDFTKDIIIPFLGVIATIVIGIIIAIFLKKKDERAKIKSLLIDTYMAFLKKHQNYFSYQINVFSYKVLKNLCENFESYFQTTPYSHVAKLILEDKRDKVGIIIENHNEEESDWTLFAYHFSFLLGTKKYTAEVKPLENSLLKNYFAPGATDSFVQNLTELIKNDIQVKEGLASSNKIKMKEALEIIDRLMGLHSAKFQHDIFTPFSTKIADLIHAY